MKKLKKKIDVKLLSKLFNGRKNYKHIRPLRYKPTAIEKCVLDAIKASTDFEFNQVTINYNNQLGKHAHRNQGESMIMLLGSFEGGALMKDDGTRIEQKNAWNLFDGSDSDWVFSRSNIAEDPILMLS